MTEGLNHWSTACDTETQVQKHRTEAIEKLLGNGPALDSEGKNTWGTLSVLLELWHEQSWPALQPEVLSTISNCLGECTTCGFFSARPTVILRGTRFYYSSKQCQCAGCCPQEIRVGPRPAGINKEVWTEIPAADVDSAFQGTARLSLFPVTHLSLIHSVLAAAPIQEVTVRHGALLYDVGLWLTPRITRLGLHSAECVTDRLIIRLLGHVSTLTALQLVSCSVSAAGLTLLSAELHSLRELVIADTLVDIAGLSALNEACCMLETLHFQSPNRNFKTKYLKTYSDIESAAIDVLIKFPLLRRATLVISAPNDTTDRYPGADRGLATLWPVNLAAMPFCVFTVNIRGELWGFWNWNPADQKSLIPRFVHPSIPIDKPGINSRSLGIRRVPPPLDFFASRGLSWKGSDVPE